MGKPFFLKKNDGKDEGFSDRRKRFLICGSTSIAVGIFLVVLGCVVQWVIFPVALEAILLKELELDEGTDAYDAWVRNAGRIDYFGSL